MRYFILTFPLNSAKVTNYFPLLVTFSIGAHFFFSSFSTLIQRSFAFSYQTYSPDNKMNLEEIEGFLEIHFKYI